jgi:glycosyltransferase involved in cell wall biosynthesis
MLVTPPELTVVVGTRDRPDAVAACLSALDAQRADLPLDVVVVDDRSRDPEALRRVVESVTGARLVPSRALGISAARNTGVAVAETEYIAFTDDDCDPVPGWAAALLYRLREGATLVCGTTIAPDEAGPLTVASQIVANSLLDARAVTAPSSSVGIRRDVALATPWDESFLDIGGEERDWYARLARAGHTPVSEPRALVVHRPSLTLGDFWRKHVRYGRGAYRYRRAYENGRLEATGFYSGLVGSSFREGTSVGLAVCLAEAATAVGFVAEAVAGRQ